VKPVIAAKEHRELIGLIPAAGSANRIAPLPCSKEIFPLGYQITPFHTGPRPKVAAQYLLEKMKSAGAQKAFIILRKDKWDIPTYFGDGYQLGMHLAYLIMRRPYGVPYTLDQAYPFIRMATVVFGFPDILFFPEDLYMRLLDSLAAADADIALGVFKAHRPEKMDMVELDSEDQILQIDIKPQNTRFTHTWIAAAWKPAFTEFMHTFVARHAETLNGEDDCGQEEMPGELHVGDVIQAAITAKMKTIVVRFDSGRYLDIGTPEDMVEAAGFVQAAEKATCDIRVDKPWC
jgi:glucose-1-phosphate thymidylyltransferase